MKPGGWGILQVPVNYKDGDTAEDPNVTDPLERSASTGNRTTFACTATNYPKRLKEAGFEVEVVDMKEALGEARFTRYSLKEERWIYMVTKPAV